MKNAESTHDELLPVRQAARTLGVPAAWLRREIDTGRLPGLQAGSSILVDLTTIRRLLLARARTCKKAEGLRQAQAAPTPVDTQEQ